MVINMSDVSDGRLGDAVWRAEGLQLSALRRRLRQLSASLRRRLLGDGPVISGNIGKIGMVGAKREHGLGRTTELLLPARADGSILRFFGLVIYGQVADEGHFFAVRRP